MIKKLKTLSKIKFEYIVLSDKKIIPENFGGLEFKNEDGVFDGRITESMLEYFGQKVDVEKHDAVGKVNYTWKMKKYGSSINHWFLKDDWFEDEVELLEDSLFEI